MLRTGWKCFNECNLEMCMGLNFKARPSPFISCIARPGAARPLTSEP